MSPRTHRIVMAAATLLIAAGAGAQAPGQRGHQEHIIDFDFDGGPAVEYVAAVRKAAGALNVMMSPLMSEVIVEPVELKRVSVDAAMGLLEGRYKSTGRLIEVDIDVTPARTPNAMNVYKLEARVREEPVREYTVSEVWSLRPIIDDGMSPESVLTAIETALDLYDEAYGPAELRFHRESGLLIARAHHDQVGTISTLVSRLTKQEAHSEVQMRKAAQRIDALEDDLSSHRDRAEQLQVQVMQLMTRAEMLERMIEELRAERQDLQKQLTVTQMERDVHVNRLQMEIHRLQKALDDRDEP